MKDFYRAFVAANSVVECLQQNLFMQLNNQIPSVLLVCNVSAVCV